MPVTQEDLAVDRLRQLIVGGDLPVGEFLSQRMLAGKVEVAVVTVRGALRRLESDGLIENVPKWGVRIPEETEATVRDRYFLREALECAVVECVAGRLPASSAETLLDLATQCDSIKDKAAVTAYAELHLTLHRQIASCAQSPLLLSALGRLFLRGEMLMNARRGWAQGVDQGGMHHRSLVQAMIDGPPGAARKAMKQHIRQGLEAELKVLAGVDEQVPS